MYHPDCVCDYVPAEVVAHVLAHAVAAALQGGGGKMLTHDVSLDAPVSHVTFYRMVQAAVARTRAASGDSAAAFRIDFGRSVLGRISGVLYSIGTTLGAKVTAAVAAQRVSSPGCVSHCSSLLAQASCDLEGEGHFSSSEHYSSCGRSFSCLRSTRHLVDKYAPLVQYVAQAVCQLQGCERNDSSSGSGASGGGSSSGSKNSELDHLKLE
jgi:hypothetical protein